MAYTAIDDPEAYFQVKAYTGTGSEQSLTFDGDTDMQPDLVWLKNRTDARAPALVDSVRGAKKVLRSDTTEAEQTSDADKDFESFDSDGFTVSTPQTWNSMNESGDSLVAWCWKAGTSFTNDASATSVGDIDSTGSISTAAGISIMSYTGTGTADQSVAHGLGATPQFIIIKNRTTAGYWCVTNPRFVSVSDPNILYLQETAAESDDTNINGTTAPSSTVFGVDDYGAVNTSGDAHIAYCFAEKQGFSKFGTFTGNGNADGPFIYTGFKPAYLLLKQSSASGEDWVVQDNKRDTFINPVDANLYASANNAEVSGYRYCDFNANGFKIRNSLTDYNQSGATYIYMAFAEAPFVTGSNGVPCNAR